MAQKSQYILNCLPSPKPEKNWTTDVYTTRPTAFIESDGTWPTAALHIAQKPVC